MTKSRFIISAFSILIVILAASSFAAAQATRTWVSGVGDDANPCSRTAPCKTFAGAISKTADGGEIDCIDPGGFGALNIVNKGITIDGGGTFASILFASTNGITINDTTNSKFICIRNLSLNGAGTGLNGIRILAAKTVVIENVVISGFTGNGIDAVLNSVASGGTKAYFHDVDIRNGSGGASIGIKMSTPSSFFSVSMDHVRVDRLPTGIQAGNNVFPSIRNSIIWGGTTGVEIVTGNGRATIENTNISELTTGLSLGAGASAFLSQNTITQCSTGISSAGTLQSSGNNRILGNTSDGTTPTIVNPK